MLVVAALVESLLMRFPPLLDVGTQPGDPLWYTVLGCLFIGVHLPMLVMQVPSPPLWWLIGFLDCFLLLRLSGAVWRVLHEDRLVQKSNPEP